MATVYYRAFDLIIIDTDGGRHVFPSESINAYNVTASSSLGTLSSDSNGQIAAGSFTATLGDIVEFSHSTYPGTMRLKLRATSEEAFTDPEYPSTVFVLDDPRTAVTTSKTVQLYLADTAQPTVRPMYVGNAKAGGVTKIPYKSPLAQTVRVYAVSEDEEGQLSTLDVTRAEYDDIAVPPLTGTFLSLTDTPSSYTSQALKAVRVNADETALEFYTPSSGITIGSTAISSGTNDRILYQSGGVVSQSGNLKFDTSTNILTVHDARILTPYTYNNLFAGSGAGNTTLTNQANTGIGYLAGSSLTNGYYNTFIGSQAGQSVTSGPNNTIIGAGTGTGISTGSDNTLIGAGAGGSGNGNNRTIVGSDAGASLTSGGDNTFFGKSAGRSVTSSSDNTAIGANAGYSMTGGQSTLIGRYAGYLATGNGNTAIGANSGYSIGSGTNNVMVGNSCGDNAVLSGCVMIGNRAGSTETNSNRLHIETGGYGATPLIYGEFDNRLFRINGNVYALRTSGAQFTAEYDGSNYGQWTVGSTGVNTFNAVGSGAKFVISDAVEINGSLTLSAQNIVTDTTTGMKIGTGTTQKLGFFNATPVTQRANIGQLTDLTGGTIVTTLQDCDSGGVADPATINDNFAGVLTKINKLEQALKDLGFSA